MKKLSPINKVMQQLPVSSFAIEGNRQRRFIVELGIIALAFTILFLRAYSIIIPVSLLTLVYVMVRFNLYENIFCATVFFPYIAGYLFNTIGIDHVGGGLRYLGLISLFIVSISGKAKLNGFSKGLLFLCIILLLFGISVFATDGGDYAVPKLLNTIRYGLILYFAFCFLFSNQEKFDFTKMGVSLITLSVMLLPLSLIVNGISGPSGITDFGFLRIQTHEDFTASEGDSFHIGYQSAGFLMLQALGFFMIEARNRRLFFVVLMISIATVSILYGGSRQAIVSVLVIVTFWALFMNSRRNSKSGPNYRWIVFLLILVISFYYIISTLVSEGGLLQSVADEGYVEGGGRGVWLMSGIEQFIENPIWGVGFGRYTVFGLYGSYPHNLFVELLCETGLIGFTVAIFIALLAWFKNKKAMAPYLCLWLAYFLRSMASEDLSANIVVFAIIFALYSVKKPAMKAN